MDKVKQNSFEFSLGEVINLGPDHTAIVTAVDPGRWAHRLYIRENDRGLRVSHIVTVFNTDIFVMGQRIYITAPDLASVLSAGAQEEEG